MKMNRRKIATVILIALMTLSLGTGYAVPQMPHQFYGQVTIDEAPAPDGTLVEARIDGDTYENTTTVDGKYGYDPLFKVPADDPDTGEVEGGVNGDTVEFYVDGVLFDTYTFEVGGSTELNLTKNQPPVADAGGPYSGEEGEAIAFNGSGSSDTDGNIVSYAWDFGDGDTGSGETTTHSYSVADTYEVRLTVTDDDGATDFDTANVTITEAEAPPETEAENPCQVGDEVEVSGEGITAGSTVNIYWDKVKDWDAATGAGLLGSTEAESDGSFEFEFDVPEATNGVHYAWVKDLDTGETDIIKAFTVQTDIALSTNSGLEEDIITVDGTGFAGDTDVAIGLFDDYADAPVTPVVEEDTGEVGDGEEDEFSFTLDEAPVEPGSLTVTDGVEVFTDEGNGSLTGSAGGDGSVNYVTGEVEVDFNSAPADGAVLHASYSYYIDEVNVANLLKTDGDTDAVGSFSETVTVPLAEDMIAGEYELVSLDADGNRYISTFTIGAVVTLEKDAAKVGEVIEAKGRGFNETAEIDYGDIIISATSQPDINCYIYDAPVEVESDGEFDLEFVVPQVEDADDDYVITFTVGDDVVTIEDFEVTDLAEVTVDPDYGLQGEKVTVSGVNFPHDADETVTVTLGGLGEDTFDLSSDGTFSGTFTIPGVSHDVHYLVAEAGADFNIDDSTSFKAGLIIVIATPDSVKVGEQVTFTGTGFTEGEYWNATFGELVVTEEESVDPDGTFTDDYFVPTMPPGTYIATFTDMDSGIEVSTEVEVTETTQVEIAPSTAPNGYNITVEGWNFKYADGENVDFTLYNDTDDWDITDDVYIYDAEDDIYTTYSDVETGAEEGNFTAWWEVYDSADLSLGTYTLKAVVDDDWVAEASLEITEATVTVSARKDTFQIGDTVAFNIVNSFQQDMSYIEVYDPAEDLYWQTKDFEKDVEWIKVDKVYRVPYFEQTAGGNPMILTSDAPLGTWTYTMYDSDDEEIASGSFTVAEAPEAVLEERINELGQDISDLQDELAGVKDSVSEAKNAAEEAKAAADAATDAIQDIGETATSAKDAADAAKGAAEEAKDAATGVQTLVYVAIGGSVIAALAAIVSLMQISRRIAG